MLQLGLPCSSVLGVMNCCSFTCFVSVHLEVGTAAVHPMLMVYEVDLLCVAA